MPKTIKGPKVIKRMPAPPKAPVLAVAPGPEIDDDFLNVREDVKRRREAFVREYIKDFNGSQAMRRLGSMSKTPWVHASEWLNEPYTQWYLAKMIADMDDDAIVSRNEVLMGLKKEANYYGLDGGAAARIGAWRAMAKILGIEVTKVEGNVNLGGGVMLLPMPATPKQWEQAAAEQQAKLKKDVRA